MKKLFSIFSIFILPVFIFISCQDKPDVYKFPTDQYVYDIPDVPVTDDYVVGVPYDTKFRDPINNVWWDSGKKAHQLYTGNPLLGEYDLRKDIDVLSQHLEWGKEAGIDFFILSWGGRGYNDTIIQRWETLWNADHSLPRVVIRFDPGYRFLSGHDTLQLSQLHMDSLRHDLDSLYTNVMMHDFAYKKSDNKPLMVFTNFTNASQIPRLNNFITFLKSSQTINNKIWIMAELGGGWTSPERWGYNATNGYNGPSDGYVRADSIKPFDAFFITDISHNNYDRYYSQYSYLDYNYRYWQDRMKPLGKEYIPTVMPGYDDRVNTPASDRFFIPRWKDGKGAYIISDTINTQHNLSSFTENPYKKWANVAKRNVGESRIILVYNWNDFPGGRNIEPTTQTGKDYLLYTRKFFKKQ